MPIDLARLKAAREDVRKADQQLVAVAQRKKEAHAEIARLRRAGERTSSIRSAEKRLRRIEDERSTLIKRKIDQQRLIDRLRDAVSLPPNFEQSIRELAGLVPVTMLPVRLETRYGNSNTQLRVRIFPDTIHQDTHEPELTDLERVAGVRYWESRWASGDDAVNAALWQNLSRAFKPTRAKWIVDVMTPTNIDLLGTGSPSFPNVDSRPQPWTRAAAARLLPERWVVLGYRDGVEIVRKWTAPVADGLAMGPEPDLDDADDPTAEPDPVQEELLVDEGVQWLVDYEVARGAGMAVTIDNADLAAGSLAQGIDLLMAVGIDWTEDPVDAAASLAKQLDGHAYTGGLSFVPVGTPTNVTGDAEAVATTDPFEDPELLDPAVEPAVLNNSGSRVLAHQLGLADSDAFDWIPGANERSDRLARAMNNALWAPTWGYFLDQMMAPIIDDDAIEAVREHFADHVRPRGPFPTLRIGRQPYGVLPVMAPKRWTHLRSGFEEQLMDRVTPLRQVWLNAAAEMPQLDTSDTPDETLVELLRFSPRSEAFRFREVVGDVVRSNILGADVLGLVQERIAKLILGIAGIGGHPKLVDVTLDEDATALYVPLVQHGGLSETAQLTDNYIVTVLNQLQKSGGFKSLVEDPDKATSILEALLRHAAQLELSKAAWYLIVDEEVRQQVLEATVRLPPEREIHVSDVSIIEGATYLENVPKASALAKGDTPLELALKRVNKVSGSKTIANHIVGMTNAELTRLPATVQIAVFRRALHTLRSLPSAELDRLAAETIDTTSHRLDAWITSQATRRLAELRSRGHEGTHLGGYGWVEGLRPQNQPTSLGYVHAPSIAHATTASILRSGHLSRRSSDSEIFAIDMSSERVALALEILQGVRQGQPVGALLGYRFERRLREHDDNLAEYILDFRKAAPLDISADGAESSEPLETVAARDVVDGVKLIRKAERDRNALLNEVGVSPGRHRQAVRAELTRLIDSLDACSDVLVSESVYQAVLGNTERSAAALDAIDRQTGVPDVGVVKTPRTGHGVHHRLAIVLSNSDDPAGWPTDPRSEAEPRLNAWLGRALGDPTDFGIGAVAVAKSDEGAPSEVEFETTAASLGMSPLSLVVSALGGGGGRATELEERVVAALHGSVPEDTTELRLLPEPPSGAARGFADLVELAQTLGGLLSSSRAASARDFVSATSRVDAGVDLTDLKRRADGAVAALRRAFRALPADGGNPQDSSIRSALIRLANVGVRVAIPLPGDRDALMDQMQGVRVSVGALLETLDAGDEAFDRPNASSEAEKREHDLARLAAVFGEHFPVLPLFSVTNDAVPDGTPHRDDLVNSAASGDGLVGGDPLAATVWLQQHSLVRPAVGRLYAALAAVEVAEGELDATQLNVAQLPHIPDDRWVGMPLVDSTQFQVGGGSLVMHAPDKIDFADEFAGVVVDQWSDVVPAANETTGVGFHFDAPGARPPQSILLAVPPDPDAPGWDLQDLIDSVHEARDLSLMRGVDMDFTEAIGRFLPATYLGFNLENKVPSFNFAQLVQNFAVMIATDGNA